MSIPVLYSTPDPAALARTLLPLYQRGTVADVQIYSVGVNDTYRVQMKGGHRYFLRVYRHQLRTREEVGYELDLLRHLHEQGVTAAYPLPDAAGAFIHEVAAPEGTRLAVLFAEAVGREPVYDDEPEVVAYAYGQAAAALHNGMEGFASSHRRRHADVEHLIDRPLVHIEAVLAHRPETWATIRDFAAALRRRLNALPLDELEQGPCHGDLQGGHAHVGPDGTHTFFDFDFCGDGYRAYDLAVFRWFARLKEQELAWWAPFLRGYRENRPVAPPDEAAVPLFICARHIWHMGLHTASAAQWGYGQVGDAYFRYRLKWLRDLAEDYL
jgi:Ser/Thr protein kinase RdoA (MazF antagonist)